jgi:hypothetical protein
MTPPVDPRHPKQKLLFLVAQGVDESLGEKIRDLVLRLASARRWVNGPPRFVCSREQPCRPAETLGGFVEIYSALPPWKLAREIDLQHLEEVTQLVKELCEFSREHGVTFDLELNGDSVGGIGEGKPDRSLADGLLGEWRRQLGVEG